MGEGYPSPSQEVRYMSMIIERKEEKKINKVDAMKRLEEQREKDHELVSGLFKYDEYKGGTIRFRFKKYQRDPYAQYELTDGHRYRIPRMVARHLNQNVHYLKYSHVPGSDMQLAAGSGQSRFSDGKSPNNHTMYTIEKIKRCSFIPLEFSSDDLGLESSNIIEVGTGSR